MVMQERRYLTAASVVAAVSATAIGQTVYPPVQIHSRGMGDTDPYHTTAVAAINSTQLKDVVAATTRWGATTEVVYAVSTNNGAAFASTGTLQIPPNGDQPAMAYPTATYTQSGGLRQFWLGASGTKPDTTTGVYVAQMLQGNTVFNDADTAVQHAPGFQPVSRPQFSQRVFDPNLFLAFNEDLGGCVSGAAMPPLSLFGLHSPDFSQTWGDFKVEPPIPPTTCDYRGRSPQILLRDTNDPIVVSADVDIRQNGSSTPVWLNNDGLPSVTSYNSSLAEWSFPLTTIGANFLTAPQPGDAIAIDGGALLPYSVIKRRLDEKDEVFVLFAAREHSTSGDLDLYLAYSDDDGETFDDLNILHLTDLDLHGIDALPEGPDQIPAGLTLDSCGGLHLLWYDTLHNQPGGGIEMDVFTAFIDGFGTPGQTITVERLTAQSFDAGTMASPVFLGERQSITTAQRGIGGLWVYACYAIPENGLVNTYVQRVHTFHACPGDPVPPAALDAEPNGTLTSEDLVQFTGDWASGWPSADLDGDGDIDNDDYVIYATEYNNQFGGQ